MRMDRDDVMPDLRVITSDQTAKAEFNMFVAENDCKFYMTEPTQGNYDFSAW